MKLKFRNQDFQTDEMNAVAEIIIGRDNFQDGTAMANAYYILRDKGIELKLV